MGQTMGEFVDALIKDGEELFDQRKIGFNTYLETNYEETDTIPLEEMAQIIADTFNIELSLASEYFNMLLDNRTFLVNLSTEEELALQTSILCYIQEQNELAQARWFFLALANLYDLDCQWQVAAGIVDAAAQAAIAAVLIPTVGGALLMGASAVTSLAVAIETGFDCDP